MPTGYTAGVDDGEITTLEEFALCCARNFGALIMMRDDPAGSEIPDFKPSTYNHDAAESDRQSLKEMDYATH